MQTITKRDFARMFSEEMGCSMTQAKRFVDAFFQALTQSIIEGSRIEIRGFGVFEVKETNPKKARNPRTGEQVFVPRRRKAHFKVGRVLKGELAKGVEIVEKKLYKGGP